MLADADLKRPRIVIVREMANLGHRMAGGLGDDGIARCHRGSIASSALLLHHVSKVSPQSTGLPWDD
jgi:hypothetical protein